MNASVQNKRFVIAGYGLPAELGVCTLFGLGVMPSQIAILTHPNDKRNAGLHSIAALRGIPISELRASSPDVLRLMKEFAPDVLLSLHYRHLIPGSVLAEAKLGAVNLHPSLLPEYRGANSGAWAIINGEAQTGYTYHRMDEKFDTGAILLQRTVPILPADTAFSLFHRQIVRALSDLEQVIELMLTCAPGTPQVGSGSYFPRDLPYGGEIDTTWPDDKIERFIRALIFPPFPPAALKKAGKTFAVASLQHYRQLMQNEGDTQR